MTENFVIVIFGATRGIGRQCALSFAECQHFKRDDSNEKLKTIIVVTGKTTQDSEKLPGTIFSVAEEVDVVIRLVLTEKVSAKGVEALPIQCDVRNDSEIDSVVRTTLDKFGRIDVMMFNSGSILWNKVIETPTKRFDLMNSINARGPYIAVQKVLPQMLKQKYGRIILVSPPIYSRFFKGKTPYAMSKIAASVLTMGLANEIQNTGVSINSIWPATAVKSQVIKDTISKGILREPTVFADACIEIIRDSPNALNGKTLIDEKQFYWEFLRSPESTDLVELTSKFGQLFLSTFLIYYATAQMKEYTDEDGPQLYELIFGSLFAWTFLFETWKRLTKKFCHGETPLLQASYFRPIPLWKFLFMHIFGASFYCINHYLGDAASPITDSTLGLYSILFLVSYYFVLVHPVLSRMRRYHSPGTGKFLMFSILIAIGYTLLFIVTENIAKIMVKGKFLEQKVLPDGYVPEAVVTSFSFVGTMFLIVYYGSRYEGRSHDMAVIDGKILIIQSNVPDGSDANDFYH